MTAPVLEIRHLRLVQALADEGGPTRAAARLHLTQSAVSHQLAELEARLGVPLFARVRRRLHPTPPGARLIEEARALLAELARVERELRRRQARRRVTLRVVVEVMTAYHWFPAVAAALAAEAPEVELRIALDARRDPLAALARGELDVAIACTVSRDHALVDAELFDDEWAVVVAANHPLAARSFVGVRELAEVRVLAHDGPRRDVERLHDLLAAEHASMPDVTTLPLTELIVASARDGLGVGLLSRWSAAPWVARGEVAAVRISRAGVRERWSALARRETMERDHVRRFIALLREHGSADVPPTPRRARR